MKNCQLANLQDKDKRTPIIWASQRGYLAMVKSLVPYSNIHVQDRNCFTALHEAAREGHDNVLNFLIESQSDIESCDSEKRTPLMWSSIKNHFSTVAFLYFNKAQLEALDFRGKTALLWATIAGNTNVVSYLASVGANVDVQDADKARTPLHWIIRRCMGSIKKKAPLHSIELVENLITILVRYKADIALRDKENRTHEYWINQLHVAQDNKLKLLNALYNK